MEVRGVVTFWTKKEDECAQELCAVRSGPTAGVPGVREEQPAQPQRVKIEGLTTTGKASGLCTLRGTGVK